MSSKIFALFSFTYIPFGVSSWYGENHTTWFSMRKMRSHLGAEAGKQRTAKGLPEVQKSVLEHAAKEVGPASTRPTPLVPCSDYRVSTGVLLGRVSTGGVYRTGEGLFIDPPFSLALCPHKDMGPTLFVREGISEANCLGNGGRRLW
jgi:hypothetical protein